MVYEVLKHIDISNSSITKALKIGKKQANSYGRAIRGMSNMYGSRATE